MKNFNQILCKHPPQQVGGILRTNMQQHHNSKLCLIWDIVSSPDHISFINSLNFIKENKLKYGSALIFPLVPLVLVSQEKVSKRGQQSITVARKDYPSLTTEENWLYFTNICYKHISPTLATVPIVTHHRHWPTTNKYLSFMNLQSVPEKTLFKKIFKASSFLPSKLVVLLKNCCVVLRQFSPSCDDCCLYSVQTILNLLMGQLCSSLVKPRSNILTKLWRFYNEFGPERRNILVLQSREIEFNGPEYSSWLIWIYLQL